MLSPSEDPGTDQSLSCRWPWLSRIAIAWVVGIALAAQWPRLWVFTIAALIALAAAGGLCRRRRHQAAQVSALIGLALTAGAWLIVHRSYVSPDHLAQFIHDEPAIARVQGTIATPPRETIPDQGHFGGYSFQGPGTLFELDVDAIDAGWGFTPTRGRLLIRIKKHDHRPQLGQRIEATGWLSAIGPTQNPGEFDYRAYLREQGVSGRMTLMRRGNWSALSSAANWAITGIRREIGDAAAASLRLGMPDDSSMIGLLDALLLGRRGGDIDELSESFRAVGLSHVLSISGAHLGILLLIVWALGRLLIGRPSLVTLLVLGVLMLFLLAVPWRTPIVRAAIMAGVFCVGYGLGRRLTGIEMLSAATLIVLIWKPSDLFSAGFQLSFGVVGAILLFAKPVSRRVMPEPEAKVVSPSGWDLLIRWLVDFAAVSVVAFAVALPLVMHHFKLVSPLAALLSMLALPALTAVLALGYLKIIVGLVSPAAGSFLAVPLSWVSDSLSGLVVQAQRWPGASFTLWVSPSVAWTLTALVLIVALLSGMFHRRKFVLLLVSLLVIGWAGYEQRPQSVMSGPDAPALVLNMFAVGDGSCFLLRSGEESLLFDCGSQGYWQIGERSIVPALTELGVRRIDTVMLSHADLDHFVGILDVIDQIAVGRVLVSPDLIREAERRPGGAAGFLIEQLREYGLTPKAVERGWQANLGRASLVMLWPEPGYVSEKNNNNSLVLRADVAGRRVLLNSDVQGEAIARLLERAHELNADVTDLAHHGSYVEQSPAWLSAVGPGVVLQSSGPRRPEQDRWKGLLSEHAIERLHTAEYGMVQLQIDGDGTMTWTTTRDTP